MFLTATATVVFDVILVCTDQYSKINLGTKEMRKRELGGGELGGWPMKRHEDDELRVVFPLGLGPADLLRARVALFVILS